MMKGKIMPLIFYEIFITNQQMKAKGFLQNVDNSDEYTARRQ